MTGDGCICHRGSWPVPSMQQKSDGSAIVYHFTRMLLSAWFTASSERCCHHLFSHDSPFYQNVAVNICSVVVHHFIRMLSAWFTTSSERCCQHLLSHGSPLHQNVTVSMNHRFIRTLLSALITASSERCCQHLHLLRLWFFVWVQLRNCKAY